MNVRTHSGILHMHLMDGALTFRALYTLAETHLAGRQSAPGDLRCGETMQRVEGVMSSPEY